TGNAPAATLASQLDRYPFRATTVNLTSSAGPTFSQEDCLTNQKLIGYGATVCVTPDGTRTFTGGWRTPDTNYDYIQMSTGAVFSDFADPEGTTVTGSLMGVDVVCSADVVAFRGLRQGGDTGCITIDDWVISFIRIDELN
ncbi:MAG: hypothetical protein GXP29_03135, partial [Planctomycetes bacterium]|nr:hypothetical protein [Planctomycetota bacterium]